MIPQQEGSPLMCFMNTVLMVLQWKHLLLVHHLHSDVWIASGNADRGVVDTRPGEDQLSKQGVLNVNLPCDVPCPYDPCGWCVLHHEIMHSEG